MCALGMVLKATFLHGFFESGKCQGIVMEDLTSTLNYIQFKGFYIFSAVGVLVFVDIRSLQKCSFLCWHYSFLVEKLRKALSFLRSCLVLITTILASVHCTMLKN